MIVDRAVPVDKLVFVRRPKPDKAVLRVGDYVYMNARLNGIRSPLMPVLGIEPCDDEGGDLVTVEWLYGNGRAQRDSMPRILLRKAKWASVWKPVWARFKKWLSKWYDIDAGITRVK